MLHFDYINHLESTDVGSCHNTYAGLVLHTISSAIDTAHTDDCCYTRNSHPRVSSCPQNLTIHSTPDLCEGHQGAEIAALHSLFSNDLLIAER